MTKEVIIKNQNELDGFLASWGEETTQITILAEGEMILDTKEKDASELMVKIGEEKREPRSLAIKILSPCCEVKINRENVNIDWKLLKKSENRPKLFIENSRRIGVRCSGVDISVVDSYEVLLHSLNYVLMKPERITNVAIYNSSVSTHNDGIYNAHFYVEESSQLFCQDGLRWCTVVLKHCSQISFNRNVLFCPDTQIIAFDSSSVKLFSRDQEEGFRSMCSFYDNAHMTFENKTYDSIIDYCEKNDIEHTNTYGYFYKVVEQGEDDTLRPRLRPIVCSTDDFPDYKVGEYAYPTNGFTETAETCASGIHCGGLTYVLRHFGEAHPTTPLVVLKLRVEFKDFAPYTPGRIPEKLRCKKAFVEKIVDPQDLGARKILIGR